MLRYELGKISTVVSQLRRPLDGIEGSDHETHLFSFIMQNVGSNIVKEAGNRKR